MSRLQKLFTLGTLTVFSSLVMSGCGGGGTGPSPAQPPTSPAPAAMQGTWVTTQLGTLTKVTLTIRATTYDVSLPATPTVEAIFVSGAISVSGDRIVFSAATICGGNGPYRWSLAGNSLTFAAISPDECPGRTNVIEGYTYTKQ